MKKLTVLILFVVHSGLSAQQNPPSNLQAEKPEVVRENVKAFLESDLDKYVVYDLLSDGTKVFKDTLDFNEYRDKAIFTITQNQTILNYQNWTSIVLLTVSIVLLVILIRRK